MATIYVQITRKQLENWLNDLKALPQITGWSRVPNKTGVYLIHLSDTVAIKLTSSIGQTEKALAVGQASMDLSLVSRVTGRTLNKKAKDRKRFHRATNWQKTWREGVLHWVVVYAQAKDFYDRISVIEDREKYKGQWIETIEQIPDWSNNDLLVDFNLKLTQGHVLTEKQTSLILAIAKRAKYTEQQKAFLNRLTELKRWSAKDPDVQNIVNQVFHLIDQETPLSDKIKNELRQAFHAYKL